MSEGKICNKTSTHMIVVEKFEIFVEFFSNIALVSIVQQTAIVWLNWRVLMMVTIFVGTFYIVKTTKNLECAENRIVQCFVIWQIWRLLTRKKTDKPRNGRPCFSNEDWIMPNTRKVLYVIVVITQTSVFDIKVQFPQDMKSWESLKATMIKTRSWQ